jgi:hypothetical protein
MDTIKIDQGTRSVFVGKTMSCPTPLDDNSVV